MTQAKDGDKVSVHYTGKFEDGSIFDTTAGEEPLEFTLGQGDLIEGFEEGVLTMVVGDKKTITLTPEKAYGMRSEDMVIEVPLEEIPGDFELTVGDELELIDEDEQAVLVVVAELKEETVVLDGNPPLAGETLIFDLELVAIA